MFTGIVEEQGVVEKIIKKKNLLTLILLAKKILKGIKTGDSIAVEGVCLTVTSKNQNHLTFDVMQETIQKTTLKDLKLKALVNLERALKKDDRLGGHFVTGHVDGIGIIKKKITRMNYVELYIAVAKDLKCLLVPKGSVCVDGVSLTVGKVGRDYFSIYLIPYTLKVTSLGSKKVSAKVNIETDILAKYVLTPRLK